MCKKAENFCRGKKASYWPAFAYQKLPLKFYATKSSILEKELPITRVLCEKKA
jgi:hypothetical protein